jgi:trans-aconitate methyltransferase
MSQEPPSSADDWDAHWASFGEATRFNPAQDLRRRIIIRHLRRIGGPTRLLDIGSGTGDLLARLAEHFPDAELTGLEYSRTGVELGSHKVPSARFVQRDLLNDPAVPDDLAGQATHAVCSEVLEHLDDPVTFLRNVRAYLAQDCSLVVTVPAGPISAYDRHIGYRRHFRPRELAALMEEAGYRVERIGRFGFPFFNLYRLLVVARGQRLIGDVTDGDGDVPGTATMVMRLFGPLFRLSEYRLPLGWQLVGTARPA